MKNKSKNLPIYLIISALLVFSIAMLVISIPKIPFLNSSHNKELPLEMDILGKLKLNYSDSWSIQNNGAEGVVLEKNDINILISTAQMEKVKSLDEIVNERYDKLKTTKKILSDTKTTVNTIEFRRLEFGSLDETIFPSDGLITYSAIVRDDVYLTLALNFPPGVSPNEAESIIQTIRYN